MQFFWVIFFNFLYLGATVKRKKGIAVLCYRLINHGIA